MKTFSSSRAYLLPAALLLFMALMLTPSRAQRGNGNGGGGGGGGGGSGSPLQSALSFLDQQQDLGTGLVDSFIEDGAAFTYTYDQALVALAWLAQGRPGKARAALDALLSVPRVKGGFYHRYDSSTGSVTPGSNLNMGHNAYVLQAYNLFYHQTGDGRYQGLARGVADYLRTALDPADGGLLGNAQATWKSTENNLAAYAALANYATLTGDTGVYAQAAQGLYTFLITECWDGTRFWTGKNDASVSTDANALGVLILGASPYASTALPWIVPRTKNSQAYQGNRMVTGFDLNNDQDTVWTEGTLQMALAYAQAGDANQVTFYQTEAEKLQQSTGALWQASNQGTTGHAGYFQKWQAVASTAWYVLMAVRVNVFAIL